MPRSVSPTNRIRAAAQAACPCAFQFGEAFLTFIKYEARTNGFTVVACVAALQRK